MVERISYSLSISILATLLFAAPLFGASIITGSVQENIAGMPLKAEIGICYHVEGNIVLRHVLTDEDGNFVIDNLPDANIHLSTKCKGFSSLHKTVNMKEDEIVDVSFNLVASKIIRGIIYDDSGNVVQYATVRILPERDKDPGPIFASYQWETGETPANIRGEFELDCAHPSKEFLVEVYHPEYSISIDGPFFFIDGEDELDLGIMMKPGVQLEGTVRNISGNAIEDATVSLISELDPDLGRFIPSSLLSKRRVNIKSDANGDFSFAHLLPGKKYLTVSHPEHGTFKQSLELLVSDNQVTLDTVLKNQ
jgi:hypothetical protein